MGVGFVPHNHKVPLEARGHLPLPSPSLCTVAKHKPVNNVRILIARECKHLCNCYGRLQSRVAYVRLLIEDSKNSIIPILQI